MEVSMQLYALLLSGAVLLSLILLTSLCLRCRRHNLPTSIQQRYSKDYPPSCSGFSLAHPPYNHSNTKNCGPPTFTLHSPISPLRPNSATPTENESNPSSDSLGYVNEIDDQGSGYLMVLPSELPESLHHSHQSLVSKSSQSTEPRYENIEAEKNIDNENSWSENYVNLDYMGNSDNSDDGEDSNYVNTKDL
ncbi:hypothetical protein UPYG_G00111080 [Umbra pygmaea]|uniref:Linker for activation of T-cells family member 2 n=1 Tax=Umbra pygmaea TaxID=75934 RepID=A0ABD0X6K3_UMBPY